MSTYSEAAAGLLPVFVTFILMLVYEIRKLRAQVIEGIEKQKELQEDLQRSTEVINALDAALKLKPSLTNATGHDGHQVALN